MENNLSQNIVFSKNVIEFVTVGVQYCSFLERFDSNELNEVTDKLTKLLPLLYLKASLLPEITIEYDILSKVTVTEEDYDYIKLRLFNLLKGEDSYLEVFVEDMKYSDTPISASISEDIADIYQDVKNCISIYEQGAEESMLEALFNCNENFKLYWGQKLVNVLRPLHTLEYSASRNFIDNDSTDLNINDEW